MAPTSNLPAWLALPWDAVVVHYHEIALKGGNRSAFLKQLHQNVRRVVKPIGGQVTNLKDRLVITGTPEQIPELLTRCARVFGISYAAPIRYLPRDTTRLSDVALEIYRAVARPGQSFSIRVKRNDKSFPHSSQELMKDIGYHVGAATGAPVNLTAPDVEIKFRVYADQVYLSGPRWPGPGGLPLGVSGRVLTLFSGGLDSPVAAWLIMRRGCRTDFVHFHTFPTAEGVRDTKIPRLIEILLKPQHERARLFLVPYHAFQLQLLQSPMPTGLELVIFRRFMVRVAGSLADAENYEALVTGDNLAQVASQTLPNLTAAEDAATLPLLRPLITENKTGIIDQARNIGTYEAAIEDYKDCCSMVARHPRIRPGLPEIQNAEHGLPLETMVGGALRETLVWTFNGQDFYPDMVPLTHLERS